jgi:hypothetical protein
MAVIKRSEISKGMRAIPLEPQPAEQPAPASDTITIRLSGESLSWLLETLRDLAPADVAERMIAAGTVDRGEMIAGEPTRGATWIDESSRTDSHENMGSAVEGIVAELTAGDTQPCSECNGLEALCVECGGTGRMPSDERQLERLGAMMSSWIGTNGDAESLGFTADEILTEWNALIDRRHPAGFRELY